MSALELARIDKDYHRVRALAEVDLTVEPAVLVRLSGPNGAGKSTLLRIAAGLTRPTRGRVNVRGTDIFGPDRAHERARIGFLGAETGLYPELTLRENLEFAAELHGLDDSAIDGVIDRLQLGEMAARAVGTLSLGYRRRAGLARALLPSPPLLLLDEPWNGLDRSSSMRLVEVLREAREHGATTLVAAHAVDVPEDLFDAEVVVESGRVTRAAGRGVRAGAGDP